jgi:hypothetical protein
MRIVHYKVETLKNKIFKQKVVFLIQMVINYNRKMGLPENIQILESATIICNHNQPQNNQ